LVISIDVADKTTIEDTSALFQNYIFITQVN
jgi:hypothetical protein